MTETGSVILPPAVPVLPVRGTSATFPVRRIYCIGRNYAAHAIEMGHDPDREPPFFFQKNPDNIDTSGRFPYPVKSSDVHHEIEMVVALKSGRHEHSRRARARPRLRLRRRPRHDASRPAGRGEEARPAVGDRQGVSSIPRRWARWCRPLKLAIRTRGGWN